MKTQPSHLPRSLALVAGLLLMAACSNSGSEGTRGRPVFHVEQISVEPGSTWQINRPIDITFSEPIDFGTVNLNTVSLRDVFGEAATGSFELLEAGRKVRFLPSCPTLEDFSDAGLRPGATYRLAVLGSESGGVTVQSTSGVTLEVSQSLLFDTPASDNPQSLFLDTVAGPPEVRVRGRAGLSGEELLATHLETFEVLDTGTVVPRQVYFEWNGQEQQARLEDNPYLPVDPISGEVQVPLHLYSRVETQISALVYLNQPVNPSLGNVNHRFLSFEYEESPGTWVAIPTAVELIGNCTESGAIVRLTPRGILPQAVDLRIELARGFQDLTGDATVLDATQFANMSVTRADNRVAGDDDAARSADEVLERFLVGGGGEGSIEDRTALFAEPFADWGEGALSASFDFAGTGGPGGDFSWVIPEGTTRILDTSTDVIVGGPNGVPTESQTVIGGVVDVVDLHIQAGASLFVQGPNPLTILASGTVTIDGQLSVSGSNSPGVGTLDTTNLPEPGAAGQGGGGAGGTASFLTNQSTPRGGPGEGAFGATGLGGQGGETSYAVADKNDRRGSGGGGGRFGPDVIMPWIGEGSGMPSFDAHPNVRAQTLIGLDGENGFHGGPGGLGAESQVTRAQGGLLGPAPFYDDNEHNDFFGSKLRRFTVEVDGEPELREELVIGELARLWAGAGGGAGGDAVQDDEFPLNPWSPAGDEKGAGGGGGAGGLLILAIGDVIVGPEGEIHADGGAGGGGENTGHFDRVGGGSGGGSGGHVVISTAGSFIIQTPSGPGAADSYWYNDAPMGNRRRAITALGGQGGAGQLSKGGYGEGGATLWRCDAIPYDRFFDLRNDSPVDLPPLEIGCFRDLEGVGDCPGGTECHLWADPDNQAIAGGGGDGSPGLIQVHVVDPSTDIVFPDSTVYGQSAAVTRWFAPPPHGWNGPQGINVQGATTSVNVPPDFMVPFFGRLSKSRSKWIPLGLARVNDGEQPLGFQFTGLTGEGVIAQDGNQVDLGTPIWGPVAMGSNGQAPMVLGEDGARLAIDLNGAFDGIQDIYRRNPRLLRESLLRVAEAGNEASNFADYTVAEADYEAQGDRLVVQVAESSVIGLTGIANSDLVVSLFRRDYLVVTQGAPDFLPEETSVEVQFQATVFGPDGEPSESAASEFTSDVTTLNFDPNQPDDYVPWDVFRFQVTFDLNAPGASDAVLASTPRPSLRVLRLPFSF